MAELEQEMEQAREQRQQSQQLATQFAAEQGAAEPGYWSVVTEADLDAGPDDDLDELLATEFSKYNALANITYSDWESFCYRVEQEMFVTQNEFRDRDATLDRSDERIMYGREKPRLTDHKARRIRSAGQDKKLMLSLGIDARGHKGGTEIHAVSKTEQQDEEEAASGLMAKAKEKLV